MRETIYSVLVVDDNIADLALVAESLSRCEHRCAVSYATSLEDAIRHLESEWFDLVLCEMGSGRDYLAVLHAIRADERWRRTPVIVLSGVDDPDGAYLGGANAFVLKSGDMAAFCEKIRGIAAFWMGVAEVPRLVPSFTVLSRVRD